MKRLESLGVVREWPVPTAAVGVARAADVVATEGPVDQRLPWASVTKLVTAVAVLVAVEEETLVLADAAGPPGSTVRHLLAHASGLGPEGERLAEPGERRIYSNAGFELLADMLAERAGMPFGDYLRAAVLEPLGMASTQLNGSPAHGAEGTLEDLLALGRELLAPTVLAASTLSDATRVAFPGLPGVLPGFGRQNRNDWGLGFEIRDSKSPHWTGSRNSPGTFGHFGRSGSFLWVDPAAGISCACLTDRDFGDWAAAAWPDLSDAVLAEIAAA